MDSVFWSEEIDLDVLRISMLLEPTMLPQRGSRPESVSGFKGVYTQQGIRGYLVNSIPPDWKGATQWRTFKTAREAGCARDAVEFYSGQDFEYNNPELEGTFPPLPSHLRLDSVDDLDEITKFVQKQAPEAALWPDFFFRAKKDRGERGGSSSLRPTLDESEQLPNVSLGRAAHKLDVAFGEEINSAAEEWVQERSYPPCSLDGEAQTQTQVDKYPELDLQDLYPQCGIEDFVTKLGDFGITKISARKRIETRYIPIKWADFGIKINAAEERSETRYIPIKLADFGIKINSAEERSETRYIPIKLADFGIKINSAEERSETRCIAPVIKLADFAKKIKSAEKRSETRWMAPELIKLGDFGGEKNSAGERVQEIGYLHMLKLQLCNSSASSLDMFRSLGSSSLGATSTEQHILPGKKRRREPNAKEIEAVSADVKEVDSMCQSFEGLDGSEGPECLKETESEDDGSSGDVGSAKHGDSQAEVTGDSSCYETYSNHAGRKRKSIDDSDELIAKLIPLIKIQVEDALNSTFLPLVAVLRSREEHEQNHREQILALEKEKLALKRERLRLRNGAVRPDSS